MIPLRLDDLPPLGELDARAEQITGVQVDSRRVERGDLFVAVGRGSEFRNEALVRGAAATLVPDQPFEAFAALGSLVRDRSEVARAVLIGVLSDPAEDDLVRGLARGFLTRTFGPLDAATEDAVRRYDAEQEGR